MKFGKNLHRSIYQPWKDKYLDYDKLKELLREDGEDGEDGGKPWTENDEAAFVEELLNVQLEKVNAFQAETYRALRERVSECESRLEQFALRSTDAVSQSTGISSDGEAVLKDVLTKLDSISKELSELEKYCRLNFTGAIKAAKKHDRRRGTNYRLRPILQVRLASLPFNSEDYSPLLYQLSAMYTFVRERLESANKQRPSSLSEGRFDADRYSSYKFFVHPDNLVEVKTNILRHLPVLVYSPSNSKVARGAHEDPTITSLYFDNSDFSLYNKKVAKENGASSLRIRWFGQLADNSELVIEMKTTDEGDASEELRLPIKQKYVMPFIKGEYRMEKTIQKLRERRGGEDAAASNLERNVENIQKFIKAESLQPVVRANYTRTAFQIPGEDRVRISIDTNLVMIREDALDSDRPCRDPDNWHRAEIDNAHLTYPFDSIRKGEITRFPYSILEIKVRDGPRKKPIEWVEELMLSHLVKETPRFSKFVHGVASLFEDYVNIFPFWMSLMETDIRKNPDEAFREEQEKKAKQAEDEFAVGSFLGRSVGRSPLRAAVSSPVSKATGSSTPQQVSSLSKSLGQIGQRPKNNTADEPDSDDDGSHLDTDGHEHRPSGLRAYLPALSTSKYARAKRMQAQLPAGVSKPTSWIKDAGAVNVEPKVWLANQRTFVKWEHIAILLATLALTLYNAATNDEVARTLGVVYTLIAVFTGGWGWWTFQVRSRMIERRSGRDFDMIAGPVVVCIALILALCINFAFQASEVNLSERTWLNGSSTIDIKPIGEAVAPKFDQMCSTSCEKGQMRGGNVIGSVKRGSFSPSYRRCLGRKLT